MFSFIPDAQKKILTREYRMRLLIMLLLAIFTSILTALVSELPASFFSKVSLDSANLQIKNVESSQANKDKNVLIKEINDINSYILVLNKDSGRESIKNVLMNIIRLKGNVSLTSFVINRDPKGDTLSVSGIARKREDLVIFSKALRSSPLFKDVEIPASDFAKLTDINFNISIPGHF
ncbi:MAG: hypothetical protein Q7R78_01385 [bacterium]|nr:hypothetical protein [bacterium]